MSPRRDIRPVVALAFGLLAGSAAAALRPYVHRNATLRRLGEANADEARIAAWSAVESLQPVLLPALLVGLVGGALAYAARRRAVSTAAVSALGGAALGLLAAGILAPSRTRARLAPDLELGGFAGIAALTLLAAVLLYLGARRPAPARVSLVLLAVAVLLPFGARWSLANPHPTFVRRAARVDFLASPELREVVERHPDQGPEVRVITPAVVQEMDTADRPALWMPPPCTVQLEVPESTPAGILRTSVAIDKSTRKRLPEGVGDVTVLFEVEIDGEVVGRARIYNERARAGKWESEHWIWKHLGEDGAGIPVEPGDRVTLRTRLPEGHPAAAMAAEHLVAGFATLVVEERIPTERTRARPEAPNVLLVVQDTLRADHCSAYGYERPTTPRLEELAARGVLYENVYSTSSWTWPSTASILTGLAADAHGVVSNESSTLNLALTSVAEALQQRGYTTAAFTCNPLIVPERYFDQGFEHFEYHLKDFRKSDLVVPGALRWLRGHAGARFFLYLHLVDPHLPYQPEDRDMAQIGAEWPPGFPEMFEDDFTQHKAAGDFVQEMKAGSEEHRRWWVDLYDGSVTAADRWFGVVLDELEELGLTEETVVVFTSDHGEELVERGEIGHGHTLHTELVKVPLVVAGPGIPAGVRHDHVLSNRHVGPTLAMLGGAYLPDVTDAALLLEPAQAPESVVYTTTRAHHMGRKMQPLAGLRRGDLVVHWWQGENGEEELELFDLSSDPMEMEDVVAERPEEAAALRDELRERLDEQRAFAPEHRVGVGAGGIQMLKGIGYLGEDEDEEPVPEPTDG